MDQNFTHIAQYRKMGAAAILKAMKVNDFHGGDPHEQDRIALGFGRGTQRQVRRPYRRPIELAPRTRSQCSQSSFCLLDVENGLSKPIYKSKYIHLYK